MRVVWTSFFLLSACANETPRDAPSLAETEGIEVPITRDETGLVKHWGLQDGCLPVRFDPQLEHRGDELQRALEVWEGVECSQICFGPLLGGELAPLGESTPGIYFVPKTSGDGPVAVNVVTDSPSGRLVRVEIRVGEPARGAEGLDDLYWGVGRALGLGSPSAGIESLLNGGQTAPTSADKATLCLLYGEAPLCE